MRTGTIQILGVHMYGSHCPGVRDPTAQEAWKEAGLESFKFGASRLLLMILRPRDFGSSGALKLRPSQPLLTLTLSHGSEETSCFADQNPV